MQDEGSVTVTVVLSPGELEMLRYIAARNAGNPKASAEALAWILEQPARDVSGRLADLAVKLTRAAAAVGAEEKPDTLQDAYSHLVRLLTRFADSPSHEAASILASARVRIARMERRRPLTRRELQALRILALERTLDRHGRQRLSQRPQYLTEGDWGTIAAKLAHMDTGAA